MLALALVSASCVASGASGPSGSSPTPEPLVRGGTLRLAIPEFPHVVLGDLDPTTYTSHGFELFRCCLLRTLLSYNGRPTAEGGAEPRPDLAEAMPEVSPDGLTWTFRLRAGLRYAPPFEDTEIVAGDIVRALQREPSPAGAGGYAFYYSVIRGLDEYAAGKADSIAGLETPDDRTLVVRLQEPASDLAYRFSLAATAPIPPGATDGHDEDYGRFLVASGPYMIEGSQGLDPTAPPKRQEPISGYVPPTLKEGTSTDIGSLTLREGEVVKPGSLTLVRNPSWDPATDDLRAALADRIEIVLGGDQEELAAAVDDGDLDLLFFRGASAEQVERYQSDTATADRVFVDPNNALWYVTMNLAVPPFDDVHVRRAVNLAVDEAALIRQLARPSRNTFAVSTGIVATHIAPDSMENNLLLNFDPYPHDVGDARAEMRLSAYDADGDGRCDAAACRSVPALVNDLLPRSYGRSIQRDLEEIGIGLEPHVIPFDTFFARLRDPRAHVPMGIGAGWEQDYPSGAGWFPGLFGSGNIETVANYSLLGASPEQLRDWGYSVTSVPSVDERVDRCLGLLGSAQTECWAELDQYLMTEVVPWVPYLTGTYAQIVSERVVGYSFDQFAALPALDRIALKAG